MMKIGITGGIGSGKSLLCSLFAGLGVPVYDCDRRAAKLSDTSETIRESVTRLLGPDAYAGGVLNRKFVASKVFEDKTLLAALNSAIHPVVARDFCEWAERQVDAPYVIMESAILFESGFNGLVDKTITVSAPEWLRIERVVSREGCDAGRVRQRIENQLTDSEREERSDYVIVNDGAIDALSDKVIELNKLFILCR